MASNSQAMLLGYLLSPHIAFQGHAAHTARWPAMLSPNGSSGTCIPDGVYHIPMPCLHGATNPILLRSTRMLDDTQRGDGAGQSPLPNVLRRTHEVQDDQILYRFGNGLLIRTEILRKPDRLRILPLGTPQGSLMNHMLHFP